MNEDQGRFARSALHIQKCFNWSWFSAQTAGNNDLGTACASGLLELSRQMVVGEVTWQDFGSKNMLQTPIARHHAGKWFEIIVAVPLN